MSRAKSRYHNRYRDLPQGPQDSCLICLGNNAIKQSIEQQELEEFRVCFDAMIKSYCELNTYVGLTVLFHGTWEDQHMLAMRCHQTSQPSKQSHHALAAASACLLDRCSHHVGRSHLMASFMTSMKNQGMNSAIPS